MKTVEEIYDEMLAVFRRETGAEASAASDLSVKLYAVAAEVYALYVQADWLARQVFPQTAEGIYLERHAALRGLERREAVRAEGVIRFCVDAASAADLSVPAGRFAPPPVWCGLRRWKMWCCRRERLRWRLRPGQWRPGRRAMCRRGASRQWR